MIFIFFGGHSGGNPRFVFANVAKNECLQTVAILPQFRVAFV
jgi:hypothetical protein